MDYVRTHNLWDFFGNRLNFQVPYVILPKLSKNVSGVGLLLQRESFFKILLGKMSELPECKSDLGTVWSSWLTVEFQRSNPLKYYKKSQNLRKKKFMKNNCI